MAQFKVGDKVRIKQDHYGYLKGDIGTVEVVNGPTVIHVLVPNRVSTSNLKPKVSFVDTMLEQYYT